MRASFATVKVTPPLLSAVRLSPRAEMIMARPAFHRGQLVADTVALTVWSWLSIAAFNLGELLIEE